jgi:hypothetical protein
MAVNPYAAPGAPVKDRDEAGFKLSIALIGMLIATGAGYVLDLFYGTLIQWSLFGQGVPIAELYDAVATSPLHNLVSHVTGVFAAALGGYWAARLGPQRGISHALVAGALILIPVAIAWVPPYAISNPAWSIALSFVTPIPSALVGALWWRRRAGSGR